MKFSTILTALAMGAMATAAPLADLERELFGRTLEPAPRAHALVARAGSGGRPKKNNDPPHQDRIKSLKYTGDDEVVKPYKDRILESPKYPLGWKAKMDTKPAKGKTGFVVSADGKRVDHYYAEDTQPYTADLWSKLTRVYSQYLGYGFKRRQGVSIRKETINDIPTPIFAKGTDKEEEPPQSYHYFEGAFLVGRVPNEESKFQSTMFKQAIAAAPDALHYFHDNRLDKSKEVDVLRGPADPTVYDYVPPYALQRVDENLMEAFMFPGERPLRSYRGGTEPPSNVLTTSPNYDPRRTRSNSPPKSDPMKRAILTGVSERDIITQISGDEGTANSSSRADQMEQIVGYIACFDEARQNVTDLLTPILIDLMNGTNSYVGEAMAWGIYSLAMPDAQFMGPFMGPMANFGWSNGSVSGTDAQLQQWADSINEFYTMTYQAAVEAVNQTGLLADLELLSERLMPTDLTLLPSDYTDMDAHALDGFFGFLESMYEYNGYYFDANQSAVANYTLEPFEWTPGNYSLNSTSLNNSTGTFSNSSSANSTVQRRHMQPVRLY